MPETRTIEEAVTGKTVTEAAATEETVGATVDERATRAADDHYEVSTPHTKAAYRMHVRREDHLVTAEVEDGTC
ncbi:hypothetical protein IPZ68_12880 [Streptomyces arenae]|nr:hypothetical protein [Streptomyces arenae]